ncbi:MAG: VOC family protein [Actinomycetota bacterium]|nr:VOC family protein [Actinomycetota bacterium]
MPDPLSYESRARFWSPGNVPFPGNRASIEVVLTAEKQTDRLEHIVMTNETGVAELRVALTVNELDEAISFYRDGLGLAVRLAWDNPDGRGVILEAGPATLELIDEAQAELIDSIEAGQRVSGPTRLALKVAGVQATSERLIDAGAFAVNDLVDTPWGDRNRRLRAPDGMQLTLFEDPHAETG